FQQGDWLPGRYHRRGKFFEHIKHARAASRGLNQNAGFVGDQRALNLNFESGGNCARASLAVLLVADVAPGSPARQRRQRADRQSHAPPPVASFVLACCPVGPKYVFADSLPAGTEGVASAQPPRGMRALRSGALGICINPPKG